ncbi:MAG: hypothetical protein NDJ94_12380 [Vicinamibacteria bacterium]|nr:hypothetical protein [Vicinamibacteria bacterium]
MTDTIRRRLLLLALAAGALAAPAAFAQTVYCGPGTRTQGEMGGGSAGTILEIGTQPPHVNWYRIGYSWSPKGEWYDPSTWKVYVAGTQQRCSPNPATGQAPAAPPARTAPPAPADDDDPPVVRVQRPQPPTSPGGGHTTTPPTRSTANCPAGAAVVDRQGRAATVLGENNGLCVVRYADGSVHSTLHWMLSPAGPGGAAKAPASGGGTLPVGRYTCSMSSAGGQFPITIVDGATYSDRGGQSGRYRIDGQQITFESGSLKGTFSRVLGPGKFGLSTRQNSSFYGVCNLKR